MTSAPRKKVARQAVSRIVADFTDRRGLRQAWESIDSEIRAEIKAAWRICIEDEIKKASPTGSDPSGSK